MFRTLLNSYLSEIFFLHPIHSSTLTCLRFFLTPHTLLNSYLSEIFYLHPTHSLTLTCLRFSSYTPYTAQLLPVWDFLLTPHTLLFLSHYGCFLADLHSTYNIHKTFELIFPVNENVLSAAIVLFQTTSLLLYAHILVCDDPINHIRSATPTSVRKEVKHLNNQSPLLDPLIRVF